MAHFAKLDDNNVVLEVHVVNNDALDPQNEEESGIAFLTEWSGGHTNWKQTSYNQSFRGVFASIGGAYDETFDVFVPPKPHASWKLNLATFAWEPPIQAPADIEGFAWVWYETNQEWIQVKKL